MANGKHGDHPLNDILDHGHAVFSPEADALIRELAALLPRERLRDLFDWFAPPPLPEFTEQLRRTRDRLRADAANRGWEVQ